MQLAYQILKYAGCDSIFFEVIASLQAKAAPMRSARRAGSLPSYLALNGMSPAQGSDAFDAKLWWQDGFASSYRKKDFCLASDSA
jgi:hypothetical protein